MCTQTDRLVWCACRINGDDEAQVLMAVKSLLAAWRQTTRDALELWLLPGLASVLPWSLCFRVFRRIARWSWLYEDATQRAVHEAQARGWWPSTLEQQAHWRWQRRLVTLVDHADMYLWQRHGMAGVERLPMRVQGDWPQPGEAALLCTFHWGAGWWGLADASATLGQVHALVAPLNPAHFKGRSVLWRYAQHRTELVGQTLRSSTIDAAGGGLRRVLRVLQGGGALVAVVDVPSDTADAALDVTLLDKTVRVPRALLRMAVEQQIPVYRYVTGFDEDTGDRWLRIDKMAPEAHLQNLAQALFDELDLLLRTQPAYWHFWSEAPRFFVSTRRQVPTSSP